MAHPGAGLVTLDVTDPSNPSQIAMASPLDSVGLSGGSGESSPIASPDAHAGWVLDDSILIQDDHRLDPHFDEHGLAVGWGQQVIHEMGEAPRPITIFGTERSKSGIDEEVGLEGFYSVRGSVSFGERLELAAWSSDGVRVVDLTDPWRPSEAAYFVPTPIPDPQGWWVAPDGTREMSQTWAAVADEDFVYLVDVNSGLWIVRVTISPDDDGVPVPE